VSGALFGSLERFIAILVDHHGGALPAWLAPEQVALLPVGPPHVERARAVAAEIGLRVRIDEEGTLGKRIRQAHQDGIPYVVVIGDREVADGSLSVRARDHQTSSPAPEAITALRDRCMQPA
jgi:threonyl-tRNA synthetase